MRSQYNVRCCALQQLETALSLYFEGEDYYSAITLAGAGEVELSRFRGRLGMSAIMPLRMVRIDNSSGTKCGIAEKDRSWFGAAIEGEPSKFLDERCQ